MTALPHRKDQDVAIVEKGWGVHSDSTRLDVASPRVTGSCINSITIASPITGAVESRP